MRSVLLLFALLLPLAATAQDADSADVSIWKKTLVGTLAGTQAAYNNWQEGGVDALAYTLALDGNFERDGETWGQTHVLKLAYGQVEQEEVGWRKATDVIRYAFALLWQQPGPFEPTAAASIRTQFAPGYNYDADPSVKISDFFAPAALQQSLGVTYRPDGNDGWFRSRLALGIKETIVGIERLRARYNVPQSTGVRFQAGLESLTEAAGNVAENVRLESRLGLFAAFNQPERPDVFWENAAHLKVNSWLATNLELDLLYDRDVSADVQVREVFSVGVTITMMND